jgi:riboflavin kinase/FMN adenylyltransferase
VSERAPRQEASPWLPSHPGGSVITVGTFDGVHRGHWAVLREVRRLAEESGARPVVVTFETHPLRVIRPGVAPRLLTTAEEKKELLAESGVGYAVFLAFTAELAAYSPRRFVEEILMGRLGLRHLVIGHDHGLGRGRTGDAATLQALGEALGFEVEVVPAVQLDGEPLSSTRIRNALEAGDVEFATRALGRPYSISGVVVRGEAQGRALGFPTANVQVPDPDKLLPREGIYAVRASFGGEEREGVLHLGPRPTFEGFAPSIEVHLFDFEGELYGERMRVDFCRRLREIRRFESMSELAEAIREDCEAARRYFAESRAACGPRSDELM